MTWISRKNQISTNLLKMISLVLDHSLSPSFDLFMTISLQYTRRFTSLIGIDKVTHMNSGTPCTQNYPKKLLKSLEPHAHRMHQPIQRLLKQAHCLVDLCHEFKQLCHDDSLFPRNPVHIPQSQNLRQINDLIRFWCAYKQRN